MQLLVCKVMGSLETYRLIFGVALQLWKVALFEREIQSLVLISIYEQLDHILGGYSIRFS